MTNFKIFLFLNIGLLSTFEKFNLKNTIYSYIVVIVIPSNLILNPMLYTISKVMKKSQKRTKTKRLIN